MRLSRPAHLLALLAVPALAMPAPGGQAPNAAWQTFRTAHYRIHFPPALADWARDVAGRIEGIHAQVTAMVGYASPEPVQVVLVDPVQEANGMAMPLLDHPYVTLWRTEPLSASTLGGQYSEWTELLVTHELTHIHHLTRPSRSRRGLISLVQLPIGPLVLKCPRWVSEGYATLVEGRITGSGRPHSAMRAAILRQWALAGKLPAYESLSSTGGFLGGNMAYLVGSAYLEWLERQAPDQPEVLRRFWKQLASRKNRPFEAAFRATFGFTARDGYQRFQAEAAHDALGCETRLKAAGLRPGELWLRVPGGLADLEVSPDGTRLLARVEQKGHSGLRVWDLAALPPKPARTSAADPFNDVTDAPAEFPAHRLRASLPALNGQAPQQAQWVDAGSIRFQLKHADAEGTLRRRPALWRIGGGVEQAPAVLPAPCWQALEPVHRDGRWRLEWQGQPVPLPGQSAGRAILDAQRQQLLAACEVDGIWNLVRVPFTSGPGGPRFGPAEALTRTVSAAWNPAPSPDGRWLYFTSLDARGMEIRRLDLSLPALASAAAAHPALLNPGTVLPPPLAASNLPAAVPPPAAEPYRATRNQTVALANCATWTPSGRTMQIGVAGQDLLGRLSWQVLAGLGDAAGPRGAAAGFSSTAWAWKPSLELFSALERPSRQAFAPVAKDRQRQGLELVLDYENRSEWGFWFSPVLAWERDQLLPEHGPEPRLTRSLTGVRSGLRSLWGRGPWLLTSSPALDLYAGATRRDGIDAKSAWSAYRAGLTLRLDTPLLPLVLRGEQGRFSGSSGEAFHLGGVTSSLVPRSLDLDRVEQLALPAYSATGERFLSYRGELGDLVRVYLEGAALWNGGPSRPSFQRVYGVELRLDLPSLGGAALLNKSKLELGVHRPLDGIMKGRTVGTLALVVRP